MTTTSEQWTIGSILTWTGQYFREKGISNPRLDAEVLLSHILGKSRLHLYVNFDQPLEARELAAFREVVKKRAQRVPVAYITGYKEFMGLDFIVNPHVLIPRPDTEILAEYAASRLAQTVNPCIADIGTGSGAILISLLHKLAAAAGIAVDISGDALKVAQQNAVRHGVESRLQCKQGDLFAPLDGQTFDAVVANPPYIVAAEVDNLEPEVRCEPHLALSGGKDGLDFYRRIIKDGAACLKPQGFMALEVGMGQARPVADLAAQSPRLRMTEILKDYGGIERVVILALSE
ncbi:n-6 adenine-specific dna methylases signature [Lucifera butyrica]|uniref:Release factor glutamine methyltransferase n=1 Tax=Lucifera butyrica TaxID=1351585 RepID=A0A498R8S6_9FIRM|nr:peptide chain release factor N(5)-glutamine methyltransferase [Lucifera butyrica]VBB06543.1 n-6 adenine-specific dna methylases signature [Lucifera butyrica]